MPAAAAAGGHADVVGLVARGEGAGAGAAGALHPPHVVPVALVQGNVQVRRVVGRVLEQLVAKLCCAAGVGLAGAKRRAALGGELLGRGGAIEHGAGRVACRAVGVFEAGGGLARLGDGWTSHRDWISGPGARKVRHLVAAGRASGLHRGDALRRVALVRELAPVHVRGRHHAAARVEQCEIVPVGPAVVRANGAEHVVAFVQRDRLLVHASVVELAAGGVSAGVERHPRERDGRDGRFLVVVLVAAHVRGFRLHLGRHAVRLVPAVVQAVDGVGVAAGGVPVLCLLVLPTVDAPIAIEIAHAFVVLASAAVLVAAPAVVPPRQAHVLVVVVEARPLPAVRGALGQRALQRRRVLHALVLAAGAARGRVAGGVAAGAGGNGVGLAHEVGLVPLAHVVPRLRVGTVVRVVLAPPQHASILVATGVVGLAAAPVRVVDGAAIGPDHRSLLGDVVHADPAAQVVVLVVLDLVVARRYVLARQIGFVLRVVVVDSGQVAAGERGLAVRARLGPRLLLPNADVVGAALLAQVLVRAVEVAPLELAEPLDAGVRDVAPAPAVAVGRLRPPHPAVWLGVPHVGRAVAPVDEDLGAGGADRDHQVHPHRGHKAAAGCVLHRHVKRYVVLRVVHTQDADDIAVADRAVRPLPRAADGDQQPRLGARRPVEPLMGVQRLVRLLRIVAVGLGEPERNAKGAVVGVILSLCEFRVVAVAVESQTERAVALNKVRLLRGVAAQPVELRGGAVGKAAEVVVGRGVVAERHVHDVGAVAIRAAALAQCVRSCCRVRALLGAGLALGLGRVGAKHDIAAGVPVGGPAARLVNLRLAVLAADHGAARVRVGGSRAHILRHSRSARLGRPGGRIGTGVLASARHVVPRAFHAALLRRAGGRRPPATEVNAAAVFGGHGVAAGRAALVASGAVGALAGRLTRGLIGHGADEGVGTVRVRVVPRAEVTRVVVAVEELDRILEGVGVAVRVEVVGRARAHRARRAPRVGLALGPVGEVGRVAVLPGERTLSRAVVEPDPALNVGADLSASLLRPGVARLVQNLGQVATERDAVLLRVVPVLRLCDANECHAVTLAAVQDVVRARVIVRSDAGLVGVAPAVEGALVLLLVRSVDAVLRLGSGRRNRRLAHEGEEAISGRIIPRALGRAVVVAVPELHGIFAAVLWVPVVGLARGPVLVVPGGAVGPREDAFFSGVRQADPALAVRIHVVACLLRVDVALIAVDAREVAAERGGAVGLCVRRGHLGRHANIHRPDSAALSRGGVRAQGDGRARGLQVRVDVASGVAGLLDGIDRRQAVLAELVATAAHGAPLHAKVCVVALADVEALVDRADIGSHQSVQVALLIGGART